MKLAITVTAQRRPMHLARCLRSIDTAMAKAWGEARDIFVSIDESPHPGETAAVEREAIRAVGNWHKNVRVNRPAYGLWERENVQWHTYEWAFGARDESGDRFEAVLAVEDDVVLSPDAIYLCEWFLDQHADEFMFLNLASLNTVEECRDRENEILEVTRITSPWAWCFTRRTWEMFRRTWNAKRLPPKGWDWDVTYRMAIGQHTALAPALSRARNTGRDLGANGGAETWADTWGRVDQGFSDGSHSDYDSYMLVRDPGPVWGEGWMRAEAEADGMVEAIWPEPARDEDETWHCV